MRNLDAYRRGLGLRRNSCKPVEKLGDRSWGMYNFPLLDDLSVRIENANLMYFGAPINTDKKTMSDFVQGILLLNTLACRNQRRPYTGALGANSPRDFRLRPNREGAAPHLALTTCWGKGWRSSRTGQLN